jgi:hypothetical protein
MHLTQAHVDAVVEVVTVSELTSLKFGMVHRRLPGLAHADAHMAMAIAYVPFF